VAVGVAELPELVRPHTVNLAITILVLSFIVLPVWYGALHPQHFGRWILFGGVLGFFLGWGSARLTRPMKTEFRAGYDRVRDLTRFLWRSFHSKSESLELPTHSMALGGSPADLVSSCPCECSPAYSADCSCSICKRPSTPASDGSSLLSRHYKMSPCRQAKNTLHYEPNRLEECCVDRLSRQVL